MIPPSHCLLFLTITSQLFQPIVSFLQNPSLIHPPRKTHSMSESTPNASESYKNGTNETPFHPLKIVGICGSIGSGKSFASSLLVSKINSALKDPSEENAVPYAYYIDTDSLAHGVYAPKSAALKEIETEFGKDVISEDGTVNRAVLGSIVFADPDEMSKLEYIVWPYVKDLLLKRITEIQSSCSQDEAESVQPVSRIVVIEAAVLLEIWESDNLFDAVWVIKASAQTSTRRLVEKRGMEENVAVERMEAQYKRRGIGNLEEELSSGIVTAVIENNGEDEERLWDDMKTVFMDHKCWKTNRRPVLNYEVLKKE